jgi:uncharacterized GH25 family protein
LFACTPGGLSEKRPDLTDAGSFTKEAPEKSITVSGRVLYKKAPVAGALVLAYKNLDDLANDRPGEKTTTDVNGDYSLGLLPGSYFFVAKKDDEYHSYSGRNPITLIGEKKYWVGFQVEKVTANKFDEYEDEFSSGISGKVLFNDTPVKDASVTIFLDASDDFKGPGYSLTTTDKNGEFFFDYLPESEYYIIARKRGAGEKVGPIYENDLYAYSPHNPLTAENGTMVYITLNAMSKIADERAEKTGLPATGFSGRVLNKNGNAMEGMHVFAYTDPVIGHKRPKALSLNTDKNGKYIVELKEGGTYYIGARQRHGDSPEPGEFFGMYDVTDDHSLKVKPDTFIENIDIIVEEIMLK